MQASLRGFLDFIRSRGVVGMAVGVIIAIALNAVVNSFVHDIVNPLVGLLLPAEQLSEAIFVIRDSEIRWGAFVSALLNLVIIAAVIYFGFKGFGLERFDKKDEAKKS